MKPHLTILLLITLLATACSPEWRAQRHVRKAKAHLDRAVELDPDIKTPYRDTTITYDTTIVIPESKVDTFFYLNRFESDSIETERTKVVVTRGEGSKLNIALTEKEQVIPVSFEMTFRQFDFVQVDPRERCMICIPYPRWWHYLVGVGVISGIALLTLLWAHLRVIYKSWMP